MAMAMRSDESFMQRLKDGRAEIQELSSEANEIAASIGRIARDEATLAVAEVKETVSSTVSASAWGAVTLVLGLVTLIWLPAPLLIGLAEVMPWWTAALVTVGAIAAVLLIVGLFTYNKFKGIRLVPGAIARMKEDQEWLRQQLSAKPD